LTNIPIELHTNYISNSQIKYIPVPDQFVWSGYGFVFILSPGEKDDQLLARCGQAGRCCITP
jgi:hypothetical protein